MGCAMCIAQVAQINVNWLVLLIGALLSSAHLYYHFGHHRLQNIQSRADVAQNE